MTDAEFVPIVSRNSENSEMTEMPDEFKNRDHLTTTEAAKLLSVSPDTVLKWVKAGKVKSRRTLGGHFRIPISELDVFTSSPQITVDEDHLTSGPAAHQYCWEFLAGGGEIKVECKDCITYRSRAKRCYELKDLPGGLGCLSLLCDTKCSECDYYKVVSEQGMSVLVLRHSKALIADPADSGVANDLEIRIASGEYEAATTIEAFRPDYLVVDCSFGKKRTTEICSSLFADARIPVARIILSSKTKDIGNYCDREVFGWIRRGFTLQQLKDCIRSVPTMASENST